MLYPISTKEMGRIELEDNEDIDHEGALRSIHVVRETTSGMSVWRINTMFTENILDLGEAFFGILEDSEHHARRYLVPSTSDSHLELLCALFL